jgi:hypothetical protein
VPRFNHIIGLHARDNQYGVSERFNDAVQWFDLRPQVIGHFPLDWPL